MFSKSLILSFIDKVTTVALVVCITGTYWTGRLASELRVILGITDISDIIHSFDNGKSSSISQLINGKSRDFQKLLKYFNGATTFASNMLLLFGVLLINFVLY